jgi:hypothetical protein
MPSLSAYSQSEWRQAITSHRPHVIMFGTNSFTKEMMTVWRQVMPQQSLFIVRKGVSLSRCDLLEITLLWTKKLPQVQNVKRP